MAKLHTIAAKHGFKTNEDFYSRYPTEEDYAREHGQPSMQKGGIRDNTNVAPAYYQPIPTPSYNFGAYNAFLEPSTTKDSVAYRDAFYKTIVNDPKMAKYWKGHQWPGGQHGSILPMVKSNGTWYENGNPSYEESYAGQDAMLGAIDDANKVSERLQKKSDEYKSDHRSEIAIPQRERGGSLSGAPHNGQPDAKQFYNPGWNPATPFYMYNMGGEPCYDCGGLPVAAEGVFIPPTDAQKVTTVPQGYNQSGVQGNKTFYNKPADKAIPSVGPPSIDWEQSIKDRLQNGETVEGLIKERTIGAGAADRFRPFEKKIYTETTPPIVQQPVQTSFPLGADQRQDRNDVTALLRLGKNAQYKAFDFPDVSGGYSKATRRYQDNATGKWFDQNSLSDYAKTGKYNPQFIDSSTFDPKGTVKPANPQSQITATSTTNALGHGFEYGGSFGDLQQAKSGWIQKATDQYSIGSTHDVSEEEIERLTNLGYRIKRA